MKLLELSEEEARTLLREAGAVGRIAFCTPDGPTILPVNYSVVDSTIVIRTMADSVIAQYAPGTTLAFEADQVDYRTEHGWSVVAKGPAHRIDHLRELAHVYVTWLPHPWATGERDVFLRIDCAEITGRRLGDDWDIESGLPTGDEPKPELLRGPVREDEHPGPRPAH